MKLSENETGNIRKRLEAGKELPEKAICLDRAWRVNVKLKNKCRSANGGGQD